MVDCALECWQINTFDIQPLMPGMMVQERDVLRSFNVCASQLFGRF